jgi:hypothetical protein
VTRYGLEKARPSRTKIVSHPYINFAEQAFPFLLRETNGHIPEDKQFHFLASRVFRVFPMVEGNRLPEHREGSLEKGSKMA